MPSGDPFPTCCHIPPSYYPTRTGTSISQRQLSIEEQLGTDPISKLAAAIERLADALRDDLRD